MPIYLTDVDFEQNAVKGLCLENLSADPALPGPGRIYFNTTLRKIRYWDGLIWHTHASAYVYIAYASDDTGTGFTMVFNAALDYIAILATNTAITAPAAANFAGLWKKIKGEPGAPGDPGDVYGSWNFNVDTEAGDVNTPVESNSKVYFKRGTGINFKRSSHVEFGHVIEIEATGAGGGSSDLVIASSPVTNKTSQGIKTTFQANEAQAFGDVVFLNVLGKAQIGNAAVIATATALAMLIDETAAIDAIGNYLLLGFVRNDTWAWTPGEWIYLSLAGSTGNTLTQTSPFTSTPIVEDTVVQMLGVANSVTSFYFNPQLVQVELKP